MSFRGSEISVDEQYPSESHKSELLKKVLRVRSQYSSGGGKSVLLKKCPGGRKSALLKNVLLAVGNQRCWKIYFWRLKISAVEKCTVCGLKSALLKILVPITTTIPSFVTVAYTKLWIFASLFISQSEQICKWGIKYAYSVMTDHVGSTCAPLPTYQDSSK